MTRSTRPAVFSSSQSHGVLNNAPASYPTIDIWNPATGEAISIKSIDLGAKTYQSADALSGKLRQYINSVAGFSGSNWGGLNIRASQITSRALMVAIPDGVASYGQWTIMYQAYLYGLRKGVAVTFVEIT